MIKNSHLLLFRFQEVKSNFAFQCYVSKQIRMISFANNTVTTWFTAQWPGSCQI